MRNHSQQFLNRRCSNPQIRYLNRLGLRNLLWKHFLWLHPSIPFLPCWKVLCCAAWQQLRPVAHECVCATHAFEVLVQNACWIFYTCRCLDPWGVMGRRRRRLADVGFGFWFSAKEFWGCNNVWYWSHCSPPSCSNLFLLGRGGVGGGQGRVAWRCAVLIWIALFQQSSATMRAVRKVRSYWAHTFCLFALNLKGCGV